MKALLFLSLLLASSLFALEPLRIGFEQTMVAQLIPKKDFTLGMELYLQEFSLNEQIEIEAFYYDDPQELVADFKSGKINFIVADPVTIVRYVPNELLAPGYLAYRTSNVEYETALLLGQKDSQKTFSQQLLGKIAKSQEHAVKLYIDTRMLENSLYDAPRFVESKNASQSVLKLFFKDVDLAFVEKNTYDLAVELNPQLKEKIVVLESYPMQISAVGYSRKGISAELQEKILGFGEILSKTQRGKQLLKLFKISAIYMSESKHLDEVRTLNKRYDIALLNKQNGKQ